MIKVSENVKDRKQASCEPEELYVADEEIGREVGPSRLETGPQKRSFDVGEDSLDLYFAEVGKTPLLNDEETKKLASQIEDGKHLIRLEEEWVAEHRAQPSALDLSLALVQRFSAAGALFKALCRYVGLPSHGSVTEKILHPELRHAIDGKIEQDLSSAIAKIAGLSPTRVEKSLIELSLDSRLIPSHIMAEAGQKRSLAEFGKVVGSPEFRDKLEAHRPEIVKHFEQVRETARQANNQMIQANLRLVISVAKNHIGLGVPLPDLIQEGNIGLMQAVQKFDHRRGHRFSTYAIPWIWQAVNRAVNDKSRMVRLPGHVVGALTKVTRAQRDLAQKLGRRPTEQELASKTGLPSQKVETLLKVIAGGPISFEAPVGEEGSQVGDFIADYAAVPPEEQASVTLLGEELSRTLESLTPRERRIIELRFGLGNEHSRTLEEVGAELGLSKERIRQIEREALAKLRHPSRSRELIGYLG